MKNLMIIVLLATVLALSSARPQIVTYRVESAFPKGVKWQLFGGSKTEAPPTHEAYHDEGYVYPVPPKADIPNLGYLPIRR